MAKSWECPKCGCSNKNRKKRFKRCGVCGIIPPSQEMEPEVMSTVKAVKAAFAGHDGRFYVPKNIFVYLGGKLPDDEG